MVTFPVADSSGKKKTSPSLLTKTNKKRKASCNGTSAPKSKKPRTDHQTETNEVYVVEQVVNHVVNKGTHLYLLKWEGWSSESNTWEPIDNLDGCHDELFKFLDQLTSKNDYSEQEYLKLKEQCSNFEHSELLSILNEYVTPKGICIPPPDYENISDRLKILSRWPEHDRDPEVVEIVRNIIKISKLSEARQTQLDSLKEWEEELNDIIKKGKNPSLISVVNNVDLEGPPGNFLYINNYLPGENVYIPEDPLVGCSCKPCNPLKRNCCPQKAGGSIAYDKDGRVKVPKGTPIYECNKRCLCNSNCFNRVVQKGRTVKLCIFRTKTGCGWGVKALETISKGAFVCEYVGEVITFEEAEKRGKIYDAVGQTYLFDLDFNDENTLYTVDAAVYGNVSHFVNHSCDPNMTVYAVWTDCLDPNLPKLALFANKEIKQGEEITFDYLNQSKQKRSNNPDEVKANGEENNSKYYNMVCKCGTSKCRKFYL